MIELTRETRFNLVDTDIATFDPNATIANSWGGWPPAAHLSPYLVFHTTMRGYPDAQTGYLVNIKDIDHAIRDAVILAHIKCPEFNSGKSLCEFLRISWHHLYTIRFDGATLAALKLLATPTYHLTIFQSSAGMVTLTQQFEFAAAHRLHVDSMTQQENSEYFGKCNNPNGHGHNYVVEVSLESSSDSKKVISLNEFELVVKRNVIDVLDHKHLNLDVAYFKDVNPTVENIAVAIWNWLDGKFGQAKLKSVRVYETPKTWADYSGAKGSE